MCFVVRITELKCLKILHKSELHCFHVSCLDVEFQVDNSFSTKKTEFHQLMASTVSEKVLLAAPVISKV